MKNTLFCCLLGLLSFGCKQNPPAPAPPVTVVLPETNPADAEADIYLADDFLTAIAKTKSPYAVRDITGAFPLLGFSYTPTKLSGFTVHEGGYDTDLSFDKTTNKYTSTEIPGLESFEFNVASDGSIQFTYLKSKKTYTFKKVPDVDYALRKLLFEGRYTDAKTTSVVTFGADGTLTGLGAEKTYLPYYDFMGGPLNFDELEATDKDDETKTVYYHYKFKGNTLELYEAIQPKETDHEGLEKIGKLKYTLVKN